MPAANLIVTGADDPSTFSFQDTTPPPPFYAKTTPPPEAQFSAEWDAAQQRYRAAISDRRYAESAAKDQLAALDQWKAATVASYKKRGASDDQAESLVAPDYESQKSQIQKVAEQAADQDAAAMYLDPVKKKWDILKNVPDTMKRQAAVELDKAQQAFVAGTQAGYKADDAENIYLKPAEQKWQAAASLPQEKKWTPGTSELLKNEENDALAQIANHVPERQAIENHPLLLTTPGFPNRSVWNARYNSAMNHDTATAAAAAKAKAKADLKEAAAQDPEKYLETTFAMAKKFSAQPPPEAVAAAQKMLSSRTNIPPVAAQSPTPETAAMSPKDKVALAEKISADHPDWTKDQVIMAVQGKMFGAQ